MAQYIDKAALAVKIEKLYKKNTDRCSIEGIAAAAQLRMVLDFLDTLDMKEMDIASMADEYYDALIKEAEMNVDMAGHCRLAYYTGCKDVLNKIRK